MSALHLLPQRLKERRKACGLTLEQAAEHVDLSVSFLSDMERGYGKPSLTTLEKLAECYQTTIAFLFMESDVQESMLHLRIYLLEEMRANIDTELERLRGMVAQETESR